MTKRILLLLSIIIFQSVSVTTWADSQQEINTAHYLQSIRNKPEQLKAFFKDMPKGGDLHSHLSGSSLSENMLEYAKSDNLCINLKTFVAYDGKCQGNKLLNNAAQDPTLRDEIIDAWSMQHFKKGNESGHDHFFNTFKKIGAITHAHKGEILAEVVQRAADQNEYYIESMINLDSGEAGKLAKKLGYNPDFNIMRDKLLAADFDQVIAHMSKKIDAIENKKNDILHCGKSDARTGCNVVIRYQQQVARLRAPEDVFAELLAGFEAAAGKDKRIVSLNMVQPEDADISMHDYKLHMRMLGFLHSKYPSVKFTLHAGELNKDVASDDGLSFHIHDAVEVAHANRIGHGVDITNETDYTDLLNDMAKKHVMVEINLSSNADILNVEGKRHPLPVYMQYDVPVSLSTDDEGITRDFIADEYVKAENDFKFGYQTLKAFSRNSLTYAFIDGESLWQDQHIVPACKKEKIGALHVSQRCQNFLSDSPKAALQWQLEQRFNKFESQYN